MAQHTTRLDKGEEEESEVTRADREKVASAFSLSLTRHTLLLPAGHP